MIECIGYALILLGLVGVFRPGRDSVKERARLGGIGLGLTIIVLALICAGGWSLKEFKVKEFLDARHAARVDRISQRP